MYYNDENIIEGVGETEAIIIKYDKDGNELFKQSWGGNSDDYFESIFLVKDGYIVIGKTWSDDIKGTASGYSELVIIKFDENLNRIWQRVWGGNESETFESFIETSKGEYVIVGCSDSTDIKNIENKLNK